MIDKGKRVHWNSKENAYTTEEEEKNIPRKFTIR